MCDKRGCVKTAMRGKKNLTIITFLCTVSALLCAILTAEEVNSIVYDIALAIFGSALLGFVMSLTEYFVERRSAMECFWQEAIKALSKLKQVKYIDIDAPLDLVHACFLEEQHNPFATHFELQQQDDSAKKSLIGWYKDNIQMTRMENDDIDAELDKMYKNKMVEYRKEYISCIDNYIKASAIDLGTLSNAYGNLDFLFKNKNIRNEVFSNIYNRLRALRDLFQTEYYYFLDFKNGEGNFLVCAEKVDKICEEIFDVQIKSNNGVVAKVVYPKAIDDIDEALEKFRLKIYRNAVPDYPKRIPVLARVCSIDFERHKELQSRE